MRPKFPRIIADPDTYISNPGSREQLVYAPVVNSRGVLSVQASGVIDVQQQIDAQVPYTDMSVIIARINAGDIGLLNVNAGKAIYGDFTAAPKTYAEFLQRYIDAQHAFDLLSKEERDSYHDDFNRYFVSLEQNKLLNAFLPAADQSQEVSDVGENIEKKEQT